MEQPKDERLWKIAKKRADFQRSLASYFIVNAFLWALWWFTSGRHQHGFNFVPWPVWPMLGWGVGLVFQYLNAYGGNSNDLAEKEYEKLKKQQSEKP